MPDLRLEIDFSGQFDEPINKRAAAVLGLIVEFEKSDGTLDCYEEKGGKIVRRIHAFDPEHDLNHVWFLVKKCQKEKKSVLIDVRPGTENVIVWASGWKAYDTKPAAAIASACLDALEDK